MPKYWEGDVNPAIVIVSLHRVALMPPLLDPYGIGYIWVVSLNEEEAEGSKIDFAIQLEHLVGTQRSTNNKKLRCSPGV